MILEPITGVHLHLVRDARQGGDAVKRLLAAIASRMPAVDCCPHPDFDDFPEETPNG